MNKNMILLLIGTLFFSACAVDHDTVVETLEDEGFYDIQDEGYAPFSCGNDDNFASGFTAKRRLQDGRERTVEGVVCCGLFKACTIRH